MVGLGRMGGNMAARLLAGGHRVVAYNRSPEPVEAARRLGAVPAGSLESVVRTLVPPRTVWLMLPAGAATRTTMDALGELLAPADTVVDGGNSRYTETIAAAARLAERGIELIDVGTSGGVWGLENGYSMMVGGSEAAVERLRPALETLAPAPDRGWGHVGPTGAGHFTKMVHNGIEYGLMQAYAEGFQILHSKTEFGLDVHQIAHIWREGSVVRSWLLDLISNALADDPSLADIQGWVADSGEGRWTVEESIALSVPAPVIALALMMRFRSREDDSYAAKLLAAMRAQFGGHAVRRVDDQADGPA
jgi:6-phosphogluconate dehydrogenase